MEVKAKNPVIASGGCVACGTINEIKLNKNGIGYYSCTNCYQQERFSRSLTNSVKSLKKGQVLERNMTLEIEGQGYNDSKEHNQEQQADTTKTKWGGEDTRQPQGISIPTFDTRQPIIERVADSPNPNRNANSVRTAQSGGFGDRTGTDTETEDFWS